MENQPIANPTEADPVSSMPVNQQPVPPQINKNLIAPILLTVLFCAVFFGIGGYYLGKQSSSSTTYSLYQPTPSVTPQEIVKTSPSPSTLDVNVYSTEYFSFSYPRSWQTDNTSIYEYRSQCKPDTSRCADEKNTVDIRSNVTPIYQGYTNSEWFNTIASLVSPLESDGDVFLKLAVGKTQEGKDYVIFKQAPTANFEGEPLTLIIGYVLDNTILYELRLSHFGSDKEGLRLLTSLIESVWTK